MATHDIVVIGASAGGMEALKILVERLPGDLAAAVFVVLHTAAESPRMLATILGRSAKLPVAYACHGAAITHGRVWIAPPDDHLLIEENEMLLTRGPPEKGLRPAIDPLFRTAAIADRERVVGVVLSGSLYDGTNGLMTIKRYGGIAVVQTPEEALVDSMPRSAIQAVAVDYILPVARIAVLIASLATG